MKTVKQTTSDSFREKGSKFIGYLFPVKTKPVFESNLEELKNEYPDATHHCYAWRINPANITEFAQDDGEPNGTAGLPILNQLKSYEVVNAAIIVVRYYGGTNLGKSGLIQAYGTVAERCLQNSKLKPIQLIWKVKISYPYSQQNTIEKLMHQFELKELDSTYTENITLILGCPVGHKQKLKNRFIQLEHLQIKTKFLTKSYL